MSDGIAPIVSRAMAYTFREKPNDPVEFFARFLLNEILIKDQARIEDQHKETVKTFRD